MNFLGLDQSLTSTGIAVVNASNNEPLYLSNVVTGSLRGAERLACIRDAVCAVLVAYQPTSAALEGYSIESQNRSFDLGEVGGVLRLYLYDEGVPFVVAAPTQLKKFATGSGAAASKSVVAAAVARKWNVEISQNDQCDAYVLARIARSVATGQVDTRAEAEVVAALKTPAVRERSLEPRLPNRKSNI